MRHGYYMELKRNNIDIDKDMLSFYISKCLDEHEELYGAIIIQIDGDNLPNILCDMYIYRDGSQKLWPNYGVFNPSL